MRRNSKIVGPLVLALAALAAGVTTGCLKLTDPSSRGLSMVALPDTTPIIMGPISLTRLVGPSSSPSGLAYVITVNNIADTTVRVVASVCGGVALRASADTTAPTLALAFPTCQAAIASVVLQPGQSTSMTRLLADSYISAGTAQGDYYVWLQLPIPDGSKAVWGAAGRVHWAG